MLYNDLPFVNFYNISKIFHCIVLKPEVIVYMVPVDA